jgi:hypothetical protein
MTAMVFSGTKEQVDPFLHGCSRGRRPKRPISSMVRCGRKAGG